MGEVYRARDPRLGRDVAVKVLAANVSGNADRRNRFEQEARAAAALNHPNILAVFDIGDEHGTPYIVSELLEGETLRERLNEGPLPVRKAVEYAAQLAQGLAAAHARGIVHRDLKPENVFIATGDRLKILDFGLAKLTEPEPMGGVGSFFISACTNSAARRCASATADRTRSESSSASRPANASASMRTSRMFPRPSAVTRTRPPPAWTSKVRLASSV